MGMGTGTAAGATTVDGVYNSCTGVKQVCVPCALGSSRSAKDKARATGVHRFELHGGHGGGLLRLSWRLVLESEEGSGAWGKMLTGARGTRRCSRRSRG